MISFDFCTSRNGFLWLSILFCILCPIESVLIHVINNESGALVTLTTTPSDEDNKEDSKEKEKSEKEIDKFYHENFRKEIIVSTDSKVLYNKLLEHQCHEKVRSPPPDFISL
jgi:hypothetical protein